MGAPTVQGLTALESKVVSAFISSGARSMNEAGRIAGVVDPESATCRIFARPRVRSALNAAMEAAGLTPARVMQRYAAELDNPETYKARLHAADSIARIMGEFSVADEKNSGNGASSVTVNIINFTVADSPAAENGS